MKHTCRLLYFEFRCLNQWKAICYIIVVEQVMEFLLFVKTRVHKEWSIDGLFRHACFFFKRFNPKFTLVLLARKSSMLHIVFSAI